MSRRAKPTARPAPHLGHWGYAVIRATDGISYGAKLLLSVLLELDRPDNHGGVGGAYQEPGRVAEQLGTTVRGLKYLRAECQRFGILEHVSVEGSSLDFWFPRLPAGFDTAPPAGADQGERRAWVQRNAARLARHIARRLARDGNRPSEPPGGPVSSQARDENRSAEPRGGTLFGKGEGRKPALAEHEMQGNPAPSVTLNAVTQRVSHSECDTRSQGAEDECDTKGASREVTIAQYRERLAHATDPDEKHLYEVALRRLEAAPAPTPSEEPAP